MEPFLFVLSIALLSIYKLSSTVKKRYLLCVERYVQALT